MAKKKVPAMAPGHPEELAEALCALTGQDDAAVKEDLTSALHQLKAMAANPYNFAFYATLWNTLVLLKDKGDIR